jgi:fumarate hydratase subunit alpha
MTVCQDTGMACVFVEIGQEVCIVDGVLVDAINEGVRQGYEEGFLRKSVVKDPLDSRVTYSYNKINFEKNY